MIAVIKFIRLGIENRHLLTVRCVKVWLGGGYSIIFTLARIPLFFHGGLYYITLLWTTWKAGRKKEKADLKI